MCVRGVFSRQMNLKGMARCLFWILTSLLIQAACGTQETHRGYKYVLGRGSVAKPSTEPIVGVEKKLFLHANGDNGPGLRITVSEANFTSGLNNNHLLNSMYVLVRVALVERHFGADLWNMIESGPSGGLIFAVAA